MANKRQIDAEEARKVGATLRIDWAKVDLEQFRRGLEVELEHGARDPETNVTNDDLTLTGKIAWAHLKEFPDYYARLDKLEAEADAYWASRRLSSVAAVCWIVASMKAAAARKSRWLTSAATIA